MGMANITILLIKILVSTNNNCDEHRPMGYNQPRRHRWGNPIGLFLLFADGAIKLIKLPNVFGRSLLLKRSAILRAIILNTAFLFNFLSFLFKNEASRFKNVESFDTFGILFRFLLLFQLYCHHQFPPLGTIANRI